MSPSDSGEGEHEDPPVRDKATQPVLIDPPHTAFAAADVPAFLQRSFGSKGQEPERKSLQLGNLLAFIAEKRRFVAGAWRRLFSETISNEKTERLVGSVGGAAFALLSLLAVVTCVGAAIALGQIKSLKSDVSVLHREVLSLRERLAKSEQAEKAKRDLDQQEEVENKSAVDKKQTSWRNPRRSNGTESLARRNSIDKGLYQAGPFCGRSFGYDKCRRSC
jgi:hypothetical protein